MLSIVGIFLIGNFDGFIKNKTLIGYDFEILIKHTLSENGRRLYMIWELCSIMFIAYIFIIEHIHRIKIETRKIADTIIIPEVSGNGEYGTAEFLKEKEYDKVFESIILPTIDEITDYQKEIQSNKNIKPLIKSAGIIVNENENKYHYIGNDTHTLVIGATRSGKTRYEVLPSIGLQALAGESLVCSDPKGELYIYTSDFLRKMGYEVVCIDFVEPQKSNKFNFLQDVIDYVNEDNIPKAISATWDIVSALVGEAEGEKIWNNGECSVIACAIICVVYDNRNNPQYQNLTNVYHFIGKMCASVNNKLPLEEYLKEIDYNHPANALIDIANVAPSRTRGSFFTSALTTLRLFTDINIYNMTSSTDFEYTKTGNKKQAIFIILPDEKKTYYPLASLFVSMHYAKMVEVARNEGGRLPNRINYNLDEIGNFTKIPDFDVKLTVAGGRNMRFNLFLQDFPQLNQTYGDNIAKVIRHNCENWVYIQSDNEETLSEIEKKIGSYTIKSSNYSNSGSMNTTRFNDNYSAGYSLTARPLLKADEIKRVSRPYILLLSRNKPAVMKVYDIGKTIFQDLYGMGDEEHNINITKERNNKRPVNTVNKIELWNIWKIYIEKLKQSEEKKNAKNNENEDIWQTSAKQDEKPVYKKSRFS